MPGRRDWPENATNFAPWTIDLSGTNNAVAPTGAGQEGEYPTGCFDVRRSRGYSLEIIVPANTVGTTAAVVELQWSDDGVNFVPMGSSYQLTLAVSASKVPYGFVVSNPFYQFVRVACITAGGAGTVATGVNIYFAARD